MIQDHFRWQYFACFLSSFVYIFFLLGRSLFTFQRVPLAQRKLCTETATINFMPEIVTQHRNYGWHDGANNEANSIFQAFKSNSGVSVLLSSLSNSLCAADFFFLLSAAWVMSCQWFVVVFVAIDARRLLLSFARNATEWMNEWTNQNEMKNRCEAEKSEIRSNTFLGRNRYSQCFFFVVVASFIFLNHNFALWCDCMWCLVLQVNIFLVEK